MEFTVINSDIGRFSRDDDHHNDSDASSTQKFEDVDCLDLSCSSEIIILYYKHRVYNYYRRFYDHFFLF